MLISGGLVGPKPNPASRGQAMEMWLIFHNYLLFVIILIGDAPIYRGLEKLIRREH